MPDQGSLIAGLKARIAELESRGVKLESQLKLQNTIKYLRRENERLRDVKNTPAVADASGSAVVRDAIGEATPEQMPTLAKQLP